MTTTWTISQLDRKTADGFVTTAHWQCNAVDGEHTASIYSTCSWADGTVNIPYADLTQATVLNWVWESVDKQATEDALAAQIALQKNPVQASGTPWSVA
jgi:RecJ-like exonuclease